MDRQATSDHRAVVRVDYTVAIQVFIFRHTRLSVVLAGEVRNSRTQHIRITGLIKIFVFVSTFIHIAVHHTH